MSIFQISLAIAMGALSLSLIPTLIRFMRGPSLPDRVISLDVFSATLLALMAIYAVITGVQAFLDVAIVLSLVTFIGTMAFAYYLIHQKNRDKL